LPVSRAFFARRGAVGFEFRKMLVELKRERRADDTLLVPDQLDHPCAVLIGQAPAVVIFGTLDHSQQDVGDPFLAEIGNLHEDVLSRHRVRIRVIVGAGHASRVSQGLEDFNIDENTPDFLRLLS
jgi:hypothetical protein